MQTTIRAPHYFAFFLIGFAPLTSQIILIRELLVVFHGNELSMGVILGAWLLWTGFGSSVPGRLSDTVRNKHRWMAATQVAMALLLPLSVTAVRASRRVWGIPVGQLVDPVHALVIPFTILAPLCLLSGFFFTMGCSVHHEIAGGKGRSIGAVFFLEALGAAVGGVLTSLMVFHWANHFQAAILVSLLLLYSALFTPGLGEPRSGPRKTRFVGAILMLPMIGLLSAGGTIDHVTRQWQWPDRHLIDTVDTPYGNLAAVAEAEQITVFENGLWLFSSPDPQSAEHAVHFALLQHPAPGRVLLVGGGISGALSEVLKHPTVELVDYVELDPGVIQLGRRLMAETAGAVLDDPRVRVFQQDGRRFVNTIDDAYDVIVVDLPDPLTVQLNRFYTVSFFVETARILSPGGVFATALESAEHMIGPNLAQSLAGLRSTLRHAYGDVRVYPGHTARFFAAHQEGVLVTDPLVLVDRIRQRALDLHYVQEYYLTFNLAPQRLRFLQTILGSVENPRINRDFSPALYFDVLVQWSAQYTPGLAKAFRRLEKVRLGQLVWLGLGITGALAIVGRLAFPRAPSHMALYYACFTAGYTEMTMIVLLIMAFQILYGSVYFKIALLMAAFMIGLMIGSRWMSRRLDHLSQPQARLARIQVLLAVYGLFLPAAITALHHLGGITPLAQVLEIGYPVLLVVAGVLGGRHFPLVSHIHLLRGHATGRTAGMMYALDLAGASVGALLSAVVFVPGLGIGQTLILLCVFNLLAAGWLVLDNRNPRPADPKRHGIPPVSGGA